MIACFGLTICESAIHAQSPPPRVQRSSQDSVNLYLQQKEREFQASERAVQARNLAPQSTAIYNLLREKKPFASSDVRGKDPGQKQQVQDALTRSVAYFLTGIGLTADQINRLQRSGLDPLQSGSNLIGSTPSLEDALTISPIVVVAEVTANNPVGSNQIERQLTFTPRRTLKGSLEQPFSSHFECQHLRRTQNQEVSTCCSCRRSSDHSGKLRADEMAEQ